MITNKLNEVLSELRNELWIYQSINNTNDESLVIKISSLEELISLF